MGNTRSTASGTERNSTTLRECESEIMDDPSASGNDTSEHYDEEFHDADDSDSEARVKAREEEMDEFRKQLSVKREQRKEILARHRAEKEELEKSLELQKKDNWQLYEVNQKLRELLHANNIEIPEQLENKQDSTLVNSINELKDIVENLRTGNIKLRKDLVETNKTLIKAYTDISDLNAQNTEFIKHIGALKEVITVSKTMIGLREQQLDELKSKLREIEQSLAEREANMLSSDLRQEYERQLQNIRTLRGLYEERARLAEVTRQGLIRELDDQKALAQIEIAKCIDLRDKVEMLEGKINELKEIIENKEEEISASQDETRCLKNEMAVVHKLFSQVLLGYKTKQDLDKLVQRLEENHGILTQMAEKGGGTSTSTELPKLLLEIVSQVDDEEYAGKDLLKQSTPQETSDSQTVDDSASKSQGAQNQTSTPTTAEEIVENLPKVWRVLMELLSHQTEPEIEHAEPKVTTCYKSVETKSGPVLVPSVSQTYIRLKDLIVEKLALIKEVNKMKQLNTHLESRLGEQEKRLCLVTTELSKTWHVVGRLRRHHHQLHTHEKILKYELQQKRKLLNELKEELEYCREKWEQAREKNTQSERDWRTLRTEFSSRKSKGSSSTLNTSVESGYSDERQSDDSSESIDESDHTNGPLIKCNKKVKKSFETIVDSSSINVAEREDPVSDMIDVADLPLDAQETGQGSQDISVSDLCISENVLNSTCDETEDEAGEITNESWVEGTTSIAENVTNSSDVNETITTLSDPISTDVSPNTVSEQIESTENVEQFDPKSILESIRKQNLRLALRDRKLQLMEKKSASLLKQSQDRVELGNQINSTLDHLLTRPTTSSDLNTDIPTLKKFEDNTLNSHEVSTNKEEMQTNTMIDKEPNSSENTDPKIILENIIKQNEQKAQNDRRLDELEKDNSNSLEKSQITNKLSGEMNQTLNQMINKTSGSEQLSDLNTNNDSKTNDQISTKSQSIKETSGKSINSNDNNTDTDSTNNLNVLELKALLNNIKEQNAKLDHKDERLIKLEQHCSAVIANLSSTFGQETQTSIKESLSNPEIDTSDLKPVDDINLETKVQNSSDNLSKIDESTKDVKIETNAVTEPSTSGNSTHEAKLAAREERLKRLEEQTKSLVKSVNKTNSKGIKIHYKLQELHNIYGSEGPSRDGTPDDIDDDDDANDVNGSEDDPKSGES